MSAVEGQAGRTPPFPIWVLVALARCMRATWTAADYARPPACKVRASQLSRARQRCKTQRVDSASEHRTLGPRRSYEAYSATSSTYRYTDSLRCSSSSSTFLRAAEDPCSRIYVAPSARPRGPGCKHGSEPSAVFALARRHALHRTHAVGRGPRQTPFGTVPAAPPRGPAPMRLGAPRCRRSSRSRRRLLRSPGPLPHFARAFDRYGDAGTFVDTCVRRRARLRPTVH
jgi:hypothetical protein